LEKVHAELDSATDMLSKLMTALHDEEERETS